jgi:hypothetical protein
MRVKIAPIETIIIVGLTFNHLYFDKKIGV